MQIATVVTGQNTYGVTYAHFDDDGLHFESELAIHLDDGTLFTLQTPTRQTERLAIHQLLYP
ncbi:MAG: type III secretion system co-regulatory protein PtrC [Pseudomonadota bacterium]